MFSLLEPPFFSRLRDARRILVVGAAAASTFTPGCPSPSRCTRPARRWDYYALVLENLAALEREGACLGAFSLPRASREGQLYLDAVAHAQECTPDHPSIVNGSVAAAVRGDFGDVRFTERTRGSELFINPLMSLYFCVDAPGLARRNLYLDRLARTALIRQVSSRIEEFRDELPRQRPPRAYPH
ncbi:hypothetical protein OH768_02565 [Streptomyces sp. NBC_01622]|nr:hypothetical protein OH768_02565 [Streptomyces sp. NBC_01622]